MSCPNVRPGRTYRQGCHCESCRAAAAVGGRPGLAAAAAVQNSVDPVAVERAVHGPVPTRMTPVERREAITRLVRMGYTDVRIQARLQCSLRTVERHAALARRDAR